MLLCRRFLFLMIVFSALFNNNCACSELSNWSKSVRDCCYWGEEGAVRVTEKYWKTKKKSKQKIDDREKEKDVLSEVFSSIKSAELKNNQKKLYDLCQRYLLFVETLFVDLREAAFYRVKVEAIDGHFESIIANAKAQADKQTDFLVKEIERLQSQDKDNQGSRLVNPQCLKCAKISNIKQYSDTYKTDMHACNGKHYFYMCEFGKGLYDQVKERMNELILENAQLNNDKEALESEKSKKDQTIDQGNAQFKVLAGLLAGSWIFFFVFYKFCCLK